MDSGLFFKEIGSSRIIGVTGSKGKTTTSHAIATLLARQEPDIASVGIDGVSPLGKVEDLRAKTGSIIFELSSWRLEALDEMQVSPATAVVTSLYHDHLNTYESFDDYIKTKQVIFRYQTAADRCLLNADDPFIRRWRALVPSRLFWYSVHDLKEGEGIFVRNGTIMIRLFDKSGVVNHSLFAWDALPLPSLHERRNLLPGILLAFLTGAQVPAIQQQITRITRLPHRLELVKTIRGIRFVNDSAATIPDATMAALDALGATPIVHILGGGDKQLDFEALAQREAKAQIKALVLLPGTASAKMKEQLLKSKRYPEIREVSSMPEAVETASHLATAGDTVLLSPGATSFGLFQHEFDRGDQFREAVKELSA
jgi:UDP-N-acetylmuramoylalanine--D-glutamate ligase